MAASKGDLDTKVVCPQGFRFGATAAGIRESGAPGGAISPPSSRRCRARPRACSRSTACARRRSSTRAGRLPAMGIRAIVANSGNANAHHRAARRRPTSARSRAAAAAALERHARRGADRVDGRHRLAAAGRAHARGDARAARRRWAASRCRAAEAIRTTDLRTKMSARTIELDGKPVQLVAIAKGSGMIHPQMATMLCFIATDASISPGVLQAALAAAVEDTLQRHHRRRRHVDQRLRDRARQRAVGRAADRRHGARSSIASRRRCARSASTWRARSPPTARARASC